MKRLYAYILFFLLTGFSPRISAQPRGPYVGSFVPAPRSFGDLLSEVPQSKILADCSFFGGDTLNGFDILKIASQMGRNSMYSEFKMYILKQEQKFAQKKYGLAQLPQKNTSPPPGNYKLDPPPPVVNNVCFNLDMENGDFSAWAGTHGYNTNSNAPFTVVNSGITYNTDGNYLDCNYYNLITTAYGTDHFGGFPGVGAGNFSARIGSESINEGKNQWCGHPDQDPAHTGAEEMHQTYVVTAANALLTYQYAVVLNDPGLSGTPHGNGEEPYFEAVVQDAAGNVLNSCTDYYQQVTSGIVPPGFVTSAFTNGKDGTTVYYLPWTTNTVNLTPFIGQTVTVKFIASGCAFAGHFAYAYVEAICGPVDIVITPPSPCAGGTAVFTAPTVAGGTYAWTGPGIVGPSAVQTVTVNVTGTYSVTITPSQGAGCAYTLSVPISFSSPSIGGSSFIPSNCTSSTGSATASGTGGSGSYSYMWSPGGQTTSTATGLAPGNYTVIITDSNGCTVAGTQSVVTYPPVVADFSVTPVCLGTPTQFTDLSNSAATGWDWDFGDGSTSTQQNPSYTYTAAGTYSATLVASGIGNCTSTVTYVVTVNPQPVANFSVTTVCFGSPTQFSDLTTGGANQWGWSFGDGNTSTQQNPTNTYTAAGTYTVTLTATANPGGCSDVISIPVTVLPMPVPSFTVTDICINTNPATFTDLSTGAVQWTWNFGDGTATSNTQNPTHTFGAPGTYSVTLVTQSAGGCVDSVVHAINVNPVPDAIFVSNIVCFNNPTQFTDQSLGAPNQWFWDFGDGNTGTGATPTHTYGAPGTYTVTLVATNSLGCSDTLPLTAIVNPLPQAAFTAPGVCFGNITCFTDQTTISSGVITNWSWNFNDAASGPSNISNIQHPCHVFTNVGVFNVILTVTSNNGCQNTISQIVTVTLPPVASFTATSVCLNSPTQFTDLSTGSVNQWAWNFGDGSTSTLQNPAHTYLGYGSYVVQLIAYSGTACADTITDTVMVNPVPIVIFKTDTVCEGQPTSFTDLSFMPAGSITGWSWLFGDPASGLSNTSNLQNPTHIFTAAGTYSVTLVASSSAGCVGSKTYTVLVNPGPQADFTFSPASPINLTDVVSFSDLSTGNPVQWFWYFGDGDSSNLQNPEHSFPDISSYTITLVVINQNGCRDTVMKPVDILHFSFYIPNAFTPGQDGKNDFFFGKGEGIVQYELVIFDRWGNQIFYCNIKDLPQTLPCMWDGKVEAGGSNEEVQQDVYVWKVKLLDIFGEWHKYIGTVTVVK